MIEQGLMKLVQGDATVAALCPTGGGHFAQLPKDHPLPSWTYLWVSEQSDPTYDNQLGFREARVQIDCYAATPAAAIGLATAIAAVMDGYSGTFTDVDSTPVWGSFCNNKQDFFDEAPRAYRRMLEYQLFYTAQ